MDNSFQVIRSYELIESQAQTKLHFLSKVGLEQTLQSNRNLKSFLVEAIKFIPSISNKLSTDVSGGAESSALDQLSQCITEFDQYNKHSSSNVTVQQPSSLPSDGLTINHFNSSKSYQVLSISNGKAFLSWNLSDPPHEYANTPLPSNSHIL